MASRNMSGEVWTALAKELEAPVYNQTYGQLKKKNIYRVLTAGVRLIRALVRAR